MEYTEIKDTNEDMDQLKAELQELFWREYEEYIAVTPMTRYERKLLRDWVGSCHSVYHDPGSRYLPDRCYEIPFLDAYREDREIAKVTRGMTADERSAYIRNIYLGWDDPSPEEIAGHGEECSVPENLQKYLRRIARETYYLWSFIWQEGLREEALEFIEEHKDQETPFERIRIDADCNLEDAIEFFL